ncbi:MAG TPA: helix-turn-helix transcriptional regulator, partial [Pseudonocardiaceae bacterium]|nr:helix-turn-helix transcriptional regulator [Pseudonocardiaceae bacterium]
MLREDGTMVDGSPTVPARRLGRELKRLREAAGKTQVEVGEWVGTPSTTISKIENAERNVPLPHLKLMLQLYEVDP